MKAGLITFHYAHHYGAQLQAYALGKTIENLGVPCEVIDYVRPDTTEGSRIFKKGPGLASMLSNVHTLLHYFPFKRRFNRFNAFVRENMKLGKKHYTTFQDLVSDPPSYDRYVCGSDQIWNPLIFKPNGFDPAFFASFSKGGSKIAYAPSFGIDSIPEPHAGKLRNYLDDFASLSAREFQGVRIINELTGKPAEVVLDPTLLLNESDWLSVCSEVKRDKPYILCYFVSDPAPFKKSIEAVSKSLMLPVINLCGSRKPIPGSIARVFDAGPGEFLSLIKNAAFVCTNSFHGTVFSILFKKDFYCFESKRKSEEQAVNSRLHTLLNALGLADRLLTGNQGIDDNDIGPMIDYGPVIARLEVEREKSLNYLKDALSL